MKAHAKSVLIISIVILCGAFAFWAIDTDEVVEIDNLARHALCVLELQGGRPDATTSFTTSRPLDRFYVGVKPGARSGRLRLSISGSGAPFSYNGIVTKPTRFSCGRDIPPGTYMVALRQEDGDNGGLVVIADEEPPIHFTGWQILSRTFLGLLVLSGVWAFTARKSQNPRRRRVSAYTFQMFLLSFLAVFLYLLLHEGGHALGEICFGCYDFARSDFWGIHGHPHSGGTSGPTLKSWQQAIITGGGPMLPIFTGWVLFLIWRSRIGRSFRNNYPILNLYFSAIVAVFIFPSVVLGGCLLSIMSDSKTEYIISNVPGPLWFAQALLWIILLVNAVILWRVMPELWRVWKAQMLDLRNPPNR